MTTKTIKRRTRPRVEETEPKSSVRKSAAHRGANVDLDPDAGTVRQVGQGSELVPVAQYASVTIGPVLVDATMPFPVEDMLLLGEVVWPDNPDDEPEWPSERHQAVFERLVNQGLGMQRVVDRIISTDRALVEESIRLYNEREAEEEAAREREAKAKKPARRRSTTKSK